MDVRLRTNRRQQDDLCHYLGLLVVRSIAETNFESARKSCPGILGYPVLNVRWTDASICVLEGNYLSCGTSLENYDLRINE